MKLTLAFALGIFTVFCQAQPADLRLNQIQIIASHNSYKKRPSDKELKFLLKVKKQLGEENNPIALDYGHLPFDSQFSYCNVRGLEIDINNDPKGGLYYKRKINSFVKGMKQKSGVEALRKPGLKVLHIKDVDYETHYHTFKESLIALKKWSDEHPNHLPMFINIESKNGSPADESGVLRFLGFKRAAKFDLAACDSIDAEIKSVFGDDL
ncbi:MAG TPA: Ca2+-dependent phosphoinositide-specific phospholipase C, partial [Chitinophagales bacterium]|nr:Ca2+-dependent phosphoinositide-specific phospholipase C [Chitinophagales bacterium]